jgi:enoyl-CoA hydratase
MSEDYTFLRYEVSNHIASVTFASPNTGNMYLRDQEWELFDVLKRISEDAAVHVAVVTGDGDAFGGGNPRTGDPYRAPDYYERAMRLFEEWTRIDKPIIVAMNGPGLLTLPLLSDVVVAERHVMIVDPHVLSGVPSATGSFLWPMSTGLAKAKRYILSGEGISADEAERIGLIAEVVDTGQSGHRAMEIATIMAGLEPVGVQMSKRALNEWIRMMWGPIFKHAMGLEFVFMPESFERNRLAREQAGSSQLPGLT